MLEDRQLKTWRLHSGIEQDHRNQVGLVGFTEALRMGALAKVGINRERDPTVRRLI